MPSTTRVTAWRNALFAIFGLCGLGMASLVSRVPALRDLLHASPAQVGLILFGIAIGSILGLLSSSHVIARFGTERTIGAVMGVGAVGYISTGVAATLGGGIVPVFAGLAVFGVAFSICDVAMNVSGAANERALKRSVMPVFHAFFSFGTMIGAGLGALAELVKVPIALHLGIIGVVFAVGAFIATRFLQSDVGQEVADAPPSTWRNRLSIWRDPRTILIGLIALGMAFAEGSANDWLALSMVDGHSVANATGALVFGIFVTAMTIGRLAGVKLLDRFGRVPVLRATAVLAVAGLLLFIFASAGWLVIVGVVLWGLGASLGFPVAMSAAADDPRTAAARVSAVATIGYFAFLVGPPSIGFLGEHFGLLRALLLVLVLVAVAGVASGAAKPVAAADR
jgi:fucose permease